MDLLKFYASLPPDYKEYIKSQGLPAKLLDMTQQQQLMALFKQDPLSQNSENIYNSSIKLDLSQDVLSVIKPFKIIIDSLPKDP
ncbi:MAG: hypothetical protein IT210_07780 [Armatimonadetes bacterium]|nr:hypothetical protein [Armatimonadota bacterium]